MFDSLMRIVRPIPSVYIYLPLIKQTKTILYIIFFFRLSFFHILLYEWDARQHQNYTAPIRHKLVKLWRVDCEFVFLVGRRILENAFGWQIVVRSGRIDQIVRLLKHRRMFGIIRGWELPEIYGRARSANDLFKCCFQEN